MKIKGIGTISKKEAMSILTEEGKRSVRSGETTLEELGEIYKLEMVKKLSKVGNMQDTFSVSYNRIPENLREELSPENLAALTDAFYKAYNDGVNS